MDNTLVEALRARLQKRCTQPVALIETHISWVLLADRIACKLKKPVRQPFVDYSTRQAREQACREELRLNRRLAPSLYRAVLAVRGTAAAPRFGGEGGIVDHVVVMRRFPPGALLSEQLAAGRLQPALLERLAARLAAFHRAAPAAPAGGRAGAPEQVLQAVLDVLQQLRPHLPANDWPMLDAWVREQGARLHDTFAARQAAGAVRECHGDLHLANAVALGQEVTAFDCIEFDPALRWTDTMSDIAFLAMDLDARGRRDLAFRFIDSVLQASGDYAGVRVLRFYMVYRALVRALVQALQAPGAPSLHLDAALRLARPVAPRLVITCGLSGSGKSTVATRLLEAMGAIRVRSDVERKRLFGLGALQASAAAAVDIYTPEATRLTFERLHALARPALAAGFPVILDAAFLRRPERAACRALAAELRVPFNIVQCQAPVAVLRERVAARSRAADDPSEATLEVLERQLAWQEPLDAAERPLAVEVDTAQPLDLPALLARLA